MRKRYVSHLLPRGTSSTLVTAPVSAHNLAKSKMERECLTDPNRAGFSINVEGKDVHVFVHNSGISISEVFASVTGAEGERLTNVEVPLDGTPVEIEPQSDVFFNRKPQTMFSRWVNSPVAVYITGMGAGVVLGFVLGVQCCVLAGKV